MYNNNDQYPHISLDCIENVRTGAVAYDVELRFFCDPKARSEKNPYHPLIHQLEYLDKLHAETEERLGAYLKKVGYDLSDPGVYATYRLRIIVRPSRTFIESSWVKYGHTILKDHEKYMEMRHKRMLRGEIKYKYCMGPIRAIKSRVMMQHRTLREDMLYALGILSKKKAAA